jgi:hypothetical protein
MPCERSPCLACCYVRMTLVNFGLVSVALMVTTAVTNHSILRIQKQQQELSVNPMKPALPFALAAALAWPSLALPETWNGKVVAVYTGDHVGFRHGNRVYNFFLTGIEAPKLSRMGGAEARASLASLCKGHRAWVEASTLPAKRVRMAEGPVRGHGALPGGPGLGTPAARDDGHADGAQPERGAGDVHRGMDGGYSAAALYDLLGRLRGARSAGQWR